VRIATWNVLSGRDPATMAFDAEVFARCVRTLDADLLALQEVDRAQPRSGGVDLAEMAAAAMGAVETRFAPALVGQPPHWQPAAHVDGPDPGDPGGSSGPAYGIALLSRIPVRSWQAVRLSPLAIRVPHAERGAGWPRLVRDEQRVAIIADLETLEGPVRVVATHLSFLRVSQGRQLREVLRHLQGGPARAILMGDLNMGPRRVARLTGLNPLVLAPTFPAWEPRRQLDHVLGVGVRLAAQGRAVALPLSDHRALVAEMR